MGGSKGLPGPLHLPSIRLVTSYTSVSSLRAGLPAHKLDASLPL